MSIRTTVQIGDPRLHQENTIVKDFNDPVIQQVIQDLRETMTHEVLIGMAAPQIGQNYQIFVTEPRETQTRPKDQSDIFRVYINPTIITYSKEQNMIFEGCGSVDHGEIFGPVKRARRITVEAYDEAGKKFQLTCDGILARVIQHEIDHLNQTEFICKVSDYTNLMVKEFYVLYGKNDPENIEASKISTLTLEKV